MKKIFQALKSKTIWTGLVLAGSPLLNKVISPDFLMDLGINNPAVLQVIGVVVMVLRKLTDKPLSEK